mgnify:CR=1 FL=1
MNALIKSATIVDSKSDFHNEKVDILINNAGVVVGKYFHEHTHDDIDF